MLAQKASSFLQSVQSSRPDMVFLVRGKDISGQRAWYYVLVERNKREIFTGRNGAPSVNLTDYGTIVYSGFGENPPQDIKTVMKEKYGFNE